MEAKKLSIKQKLLGTILPLTIIIVLLLTGISYYISKSIITSYSKNLLSSSINNQSNAIESWLNENLASFQIAKRTIEKLKPNHAQLQTILDAYYGWNDNYPDGFYIGDEKNHLMTATDAAKKAVHPTETIWYQEGLTHINMGFTQAYTDPLGQAVVSASGILNDGDSGLKVISADLSLERISIIVNSFIEMEHAQAFLVNQTDASILAHRDSSLIGTSLKTSSDVFLQDVASHLESSDDTIQEIDHNMTAFSKIDGTDWVLVSYIPTSIIYKDVNVVRLLMIGTGLVCVLILAILIERSIHVIIRPVKELTHIVNALTSGDFTVSAEVKSNDEIGMMSRGMNQFIITMRGMIAAIHKACQTLQTQADHSTYISGEMYQATTTQGQSMKELNITVEQLSHSVNDIAQHAGTLASVVADTRKDSSKVNHKMQQTVTISTQGKKDMQKVSQAMSAIHDSVLRLQQAIDKVGKASGEITNITDVIASIAKQTNLLSLNAAIEAARAGDAGRGFAVVAHEIGQLAQDSSHSVADIEKLIAQINDLANDAVKQAEDSTTSIHDSSQLIGEALKTFDTIFQNIDSANQLIQEMIGKVEKVDDVAANVAAISEEQAASSQEILATSDTMVEQANSLTGSGKTVADDAKKLTGLAEELAHQMSAFKVSEGGDNDEK